MSGLSSSKHARKHTWHTPIHILMQASVHDSVEDARTALRLYLKYRELVKEGKLHEKLEELYSWGKQHGWEPVTLGEDGKPIPPSGILNPL